MIKFKVNNGFIYTDVDRQIAKFVIKWKNHIQGGSFIHAPIEVDILTYYAINSTNSFIMCQF